MSHVALSPETHLGKSHGNGHCVALVRAAATMPPTSQWRRGVPVGAATVPSGTVIATFDEQGRYANALDGSSHAAILIEQTERGLSVIDQWRTDLGPRVAQRRIIRPKGGAGPAADDADRYFVVET